RTTSTIAPAAHGLTTTTNETATATTNKTPTTATTNERPTTASRYYHRTHRAAPLSPRPNHHAAPADETPTAALPHPHDNPAQGTRRCGHRPLFHTSTPPRWNVRYTDISDSAPPTPALLLAGVRLLPAQERSLSASPRRSREAEPREPLHRHRIGRKGLRLWRTSRSSTGSTAAPCTGTTPARF